MVPYYHHVLVHLSYYKQYLTILLIDLSEGWKKFLYYYLFHKGYEKPKTLIEKKSTI